MTLFGIKDEGRAFKKRWTVGSGVDGSIAEGAPTFSGSGGNVAIGTDGQGTTSDRFTGLAASLSTDTASAAGEVWTYEPLPGVLYMGSPKSATAANTQAKIDALKYKRVVFDLTTGTWTVDSAAADSATNTIVIADGDYQANLLHFYVMDKGTYLGA